MATDQTVLYIIILVAIALVLLLIGVVLAYLRIVKRYLDLKEGKIEEVDPRIIIKQAQEKSQRILEDAQFQAHQVITKAQAFLATNESVLSKELEITTQDYAKKYEGNLEIVQKNIIKILENIPEDSKKMLLETYEKNGYLVEERYIEQYLIQMAVGYFRTPERVKYWLVKNGLFGKHVKFLESLIAIHYE